MKSVSPCEKRDIFQNYKHTFHKHDTKTGFVYEKINQIKGYILDICKGYAYPDWAALEDKTHVNILDSI